MKVRQEVYTKREVDRLNARALARYDMMLARALRAEKCADAYAKAITALCEDMSRARTVLRRFAEFYGGPSHHRDDCMCPEVCQEHVLIDAVEVELKKQDAVDAATRKCG